MVGRFLKKHFLTILVIVSTAIAQIVLNFVTNVSMMENFVMSAVLGLNMTFLFDFARNIDDTSEKVEDLNRILPDSRIQVYESVDAAVKRFKQIVQDGHHTIDIVLFDTKVRTSDPTKVSKMQRFISDCTNNSRIKLRMTFVPAEDSICERIENALNAIKKQNNSYFAFQHSTVSFASFLIIDNEIMSIRTPFQNGSPTSYTYLNGSTTGGAVVYDSGKFLFSHHATDPCSGRLVNSFDLVRLHRFGDADDTAQENTPTNRLPSYTAMIQYANSLEDVAAALIKERYDAMTQEFQDVGASNDDGSASWMLKLDKNANGVPTANIKNYALLLENDPLLKGRIKNDSFADRTFGIAPLPWGNRISMREGEDFTWCDADDAGLRGYFERLIPSSNRSKLEDALMNHLAAHSFNPVQDYLNGLKWDGTSRLDTLFIDYLGAEDNDYIRAVTRKTFTAAVARAMTPGCKYDQMTVLCGPQGIGKSTIIDKMSRGYYNDSIRTFEGKEASELLQGVWLVEVAELDQYWNANHARIKQFLSVRADRYRAAYGHRAAKHERTCIFFGTCNSPEFLRDTTGNRRFWPVDVGVLPHSKSIFTDLTDDVISQVWAEAKMCWQMGEPLFLSGNVATQAAQQQESHMEITPMEEMLSEWLEKPVPDDWRKWPLDRRRDFWSGMAEGGSYTMVKRERVCVGEIMREMLMLPEGEAMTRNATARDIKNALCKLGWTKRKTPLDYPPYDKQRLVYERPVSPKSKM